MLTRSGVGKSKRAADAAQLNECHCELCLLAAHRIAASSAKIFIRSKYLLNRQGKSHPVSRRRDRGLVRSALDVRRTPPRTKMTFETALTSSGCTRWS